MPLDPTKTSKTLDVAKTVKLTGDAVVGDVKAGKKFYKDDPETQLTGTMPTKAIVAANDDYEEGYHAGNPGGLDAIDTDLAVANIKDGVTIFGKLGTFVGGPLAEDTTGSADTAKATNVTDSADRGDHTLTPEQEETVATKTLTFAALSMAVAVGYFNGRTDSGAPMRFRLYMDGVEEAEISIATTKDNYILVATKALSGTKTCDVRMFNASPHTSYNYSGYGDASPIAIGIGIGSVKI